MISSMSWAGCARGVCPLCPELAGSASRISRFCASLAGAPRPGLVGVACIVTRQHHATIPSHNGKKSSSPCGYCAKTLKCSLSLHQPLLRQPRRHITSWAGRGRLRCHTLNMMSSLLHLMTLRNIILSSFGASPAGALHRVLVCETRSPRGVWIAL